MKIETNGYVLKREDTGEYYCSILDSTAKAYWWDEDIDEALVFEELEIAELVADMLADEGFKVGIRGYRKTIEVFDTID